MIKYFRAISNGALVLKDMCPANGAHKCLILSDRIDDDYQYSGMEISIQALGKMLSYKDVGTLDRMSETYKALVKDIIKIYGWRGFLNEVSYYFANVRVCQTGFTFRVRSDESPHASILDMSYIMKGLYKLYEGNWSMAPKWLWDLFDTTKFEMPDGKVETFRRINNDKVDMHKRDLMDLKDSNEYFLALYNYSLFLDHIKRVKKYPYKRERHQDYGWNVCTLYNGFIYRGTITGRFTARLGLLHTSFRKVGGASIDFESIEFKMLLFALSKDVFKISGKSASKMRDAYTFIAELSGLHRKTVKDAVMDTMYSGFPMYKRKKHKDVFEAVDKILGFDFASKICEVESSLIKKVIKNFDPDKGMSYIKSGVFGAVVCYRGFSTRDGKCFYMDEKKEKELTGNVLLSHLIQSSARNVLCAFMIAIRRVCKDVNVVCHTHDEVILDPWYKLPTNKVFEIYKEMHKFFPSIDEDDLYHLVSFKS